jgi:predicted nucleotidyltransferase
MATTVLHQQLQPLTQALQRQFGDDLIALVLFGSRARGDHHPGSDWDLLLIAHRLPERAFKRHLTVKTSLPVEWRGKVSILAKTPAEFEDHLPR